MAHIHANLSIKCPAKRRNGKWSSKLVKGVVVGAMAAVAIGLTAPISSAANEATWQQGCRGYWYSTSGHGNCSSASNYPSYRYFTQYDCNVEIDTEHADTLYNGYSGKYDSRECTFKINKTHVTYLV